MNRYEETATANYQPSGGATLGDGANLHTIEARVLVPLYSALTAGAILAAGVALAGVLWFPHSALISACFAYVVGFGAWWIVMQLRLEGKLDRLIKLAEMKYNIDLPGGYKGGPPQAEPEKRKAIVSVEDYEGPYGSTDNVNVDDVDVVTKIARDVIEHGYKFSYDIVNRGICTRGAMDNLRDELLNHGIISYRDKDHVLEGFDISRAGRAFFREMAK